MTLRGTAALLTAAAAGGGAVVVLRRRRRRRSDDIDDVVVTVLRPPAEVAAAVAETEELGPEVDVELRAAPGDRGTEVSVRRSGPGATAGGPDVGELRERVRRLKQTLEAGEVLRVTPRPEGHRRPTPGGLLIELADRRSGRWGTK